MKLTQAWYNKIPDNYLDRLMPIPCKMVHEQICGPCAFIM